jgi:HlyD family secretion protein
MKKLIVTIIVLVAVGGAAGAYYMHQTTPEPVATTLQVTRGDIADVVQATGTLEAVTTVQVGTQVSGTVQELYADYNSIVKKGQIIARLDPSLLQTQIEQQRANVTRSQADLDRLKVSLADAKQKLDRARALSDKNLLPRTELETADVNVKSTDAQIKSSEASLVQAKSQLNTAEVNLQHTIITAPIDGIVISRNVEPGQTVAASMSAPVLYVLAADLTQMKVNANIDEADVGRMRPGQSVTFRVDAYPTEVFTGNVWQVRLQPTTVQNVVTYQTVIEVPNKQYKLKPGMTANVAIEVARRTDVLRLPTAAVRFRPTTDMFAALNQPVPPELQRGQRGAGGRTGASGQTPAAGAPAATPGSAAPSTATPQGATPPAAGAQPRGQQSASRGAAAENRGGGDRASGNRGESGRGVGGGGRGGFDPNMTPEERQKRLEERMATMTPEQRDQFQARMRERAAQGGGRGGFGGGDRGGSGGGRGSAGGDQQARGNQGSNARQGTATPRPAPKGRVASTPSMANTNATTIDALFPEIVLVERRERVWLWILPDKKLKLVNVRTGISDGTWTELVDPAELHEGSEVVTNVVTGLEPKTNTTTGGSQNPLMGPQRGRGGPGGGGRGR